MIEARDDFLGFFAGRQRCEEEYPISDRRTIRRGEPAAVLRFANAVLSEDRDSPSAILRGDGVQNERAVSR